MDIMTQIREGMHVVDADGKDVGKVSDFAAGDPQGVTVEGQDDVRDEPRLVGSPGILADAGLPREEVERLSHSGWVKVHKGLFTGDRFLPADEIDRVDDDKLRLKPGITLK
ncbi:MAG: hypothetical protein M3116_03025 [Actinomycetota bacterium]|nr:hypothetical protein [Actinomycetota bacterium]